MLTKQVSSTTERIDVIMFEVTQDDIDNGFACLGRSCPVARALQRELDTKEDVVVERLYVYIGNIQYRTSENLYRFIVDYDNGKDVYPFTAKIEKKSKSC